MAAATDPDSPVGPGRTDAEHLSRPRGRRAARRATGSGRPPRGARPRTAGDPARSAIVRATRRSRSVPRPLSPSRSASSIARRAATALSRQIDRSSRPDIRPFRRPLRRARWTLRARATRSATTAELSGSSAAMSAAGAHPRHRDPHVDPVAERPRHPARVALRNLRARTGTVPVSSPASPHGHGFIAATNWNRAGNVVARPTRATDTRPSSSGWRSASSTSRENSGSSSRKSTP